MVLKVIYSYYYYYYIGKYTIGSSRLSHNSTNYVVKQFKNVVWILSVNKYKNLLILIPNLFKS